MPDTNIAKSLHAEALNSFLGSIFREGPFNSNWFDSRSNSTRSDDHERIYTRT